MLHQKRSHKACIVEFTIQLGITGIEKIITNLIGMCIGRHRVEAHKGGGISHYTMFPWTHLSMSLWEVTDYSLKAIKRI